MVNVEWKGGLAFEATAPTGMRFTMGETAEGVDVGPFPMATLLSAIAGCAGMDVLSILEKKRQKVTAYRIEIDGTRPPQGTHPRPYETITMHHIVSGESIDPAAVERAIQLTEEKYCSVLATLQVGPKFSSGYTIEELSGAV